MKKLTTILIDRHGYIPLLMIVFSVILLHEHEIVASILGWCLAVMAVYPSVLVCLPDAQ